MHITSYTDYSLRVLIYLSVQGDQLTTIQQIADSYGISKNHLMKVVHQLNRKGYIETVRGKHGGLRMHRKPEDINIGVLVRETEDVTLLECMGPDNGCNISPVCGLKQIMSDALGAFFAALDNYTLADVVKDRHQSQIMRILQIV
ncbi:MAG: Rrf2 family transcriptional regulator [Marinobacter sp.]|nr:Rrf2 family transcriptional regulator [Marinobacter sp.]